MADRSYIALLRKDDNSDYGVDFPDFPGCITAGKTLEEARTLAREALAAHIDLMREDGEDIPAPSSLDAVMGSEEHRDGVAILVEPPEPRAVRVNITLPSEALAQIDEAADQLGQSRSSLIARATLAYIAQTRITTAKRSRPARRKHG